MIFIARDEAALAKKAAEILMESVRDAIAERGHASWAIGGGSTPKVIFPLLTEPYYRERIDWKNISLFWGDERCVPPDHADSNYKLAKDLLLSKVPLPASSIHRMAGEMSSPQAAAKAYENKLKTIFKFDRPFPKFDLIWLGMGADGHTASLFPGTSALEENEKWVVGHHVENLSSNRITLTFPVINNARRVVIITPGENKATVLRDLFHADMPKSRYPVQRVKPVNGDLIWLLDKQAAAKLPADALNSAKNI